ncbi:putative bifunctional diguanylate cyclase/phosphodiesterase [Kineococcus xinjiangensis]|nr:EAL domain-containing protein [Kineococcus xinjiangensis]
MGDEPELGRALVEALMLHPHDALLVMRAVRDEDGRVVDFTYALTNDTAELNAGRPLAGRSMLEAWSREDSPFLDVFTAMLEDGGCLLSEYDGSGPTSDPALHGRTFAVYARAAGPDLVVAQYRDITGLRRAEALLQEQATHDVLTGLPNRRLFLDRLDVAMARLERHPATLAVLYCDLDHFKQVNDTLGHGVGDRLLQQVATALRGALRPADTLARFGGDEFVVLCEDLESTDAAHDLAERLRAAVPPALRIEDRDVQVGLSVGVSTTDRPAPVERVLSEADTALYAAKRAGRRRVHVFGEEMRAASRRRYHVESGLYGALEREEFLLHYQPKVHITSGRISGVEALLRWQHPDEGLLLPVEFLDVVDDGGLVLPVGEWVLRRACEEAARWGSAAETPLVQVNLSARQVTSPLLVELVRDVLAVTGLPPARLELEVTEGQVLTNMRAAVAVLQDVRDLGVGVALDDFGSGYSSLAWLQRLPVTTLKLDRAFLSDLTTAPGSAAIIRAVVDLGHALGLRVVGEGVENAGQLEALRGLGVDEAQGFHLAHPMPAASLRRMLSPPASR